MPTLAHPRQKPSLSRACGLCVDVGHTFTLWRFVSLALMGGKQQLALSFADIVWSLVFALDGSYGGEKSVRA